VLNTLTLSRKYLTGQRDEDWFALTRRGGDDADKQGETNDCQRHFERK